MEQYFFMQDLNKTLDAHHVYMVKYKYSQREKEMRTLYTTTYKGFTLRVRESCYPKDGISALYNDFIAEAWVYRQEIDCEELDTGYFGRNMMEATKRLKSLIDTMINNGRKI